MIDEKHSLLIHRAIDGEITETERIELNHLLETSPEARHFHDQLNGFSSIPSHFPSVNVPTDLKSNVLARIAGTRHSALPKTSNPRTIGALIGALFTPRLAYGLAAGLIIGISVGAIGFRGAVGHLDPLDLSGTVLAGAEDSALKRMDADSFVQPQAKGRLSVDVGSGLTYIQVDIESVQEAAVVLDFDPNAYVLRAIEQQSPGTTNLVTGDGQVRASHLGQNRYLFVLGSVGESTGSPVIMSVESNGVIYERRLNLSDASEL